MAILNFSLDDFSMFLRLLEMSMSKLEQYSVVAVNTLDPPRNLSFTDVRSYAEEVTVNIMWGLFASIAWQI